MSASPVRRCVAVASHGRRCQQTQFRGSPYCWHHLQSRKVPAPSRPRGVTPIRVATEPTPLPAVDRVALAMRLANDVPPEALVALVELVESRRDIDLTLSKEHGEIVVTRSSPRRRSGAAPG